MTIRFDNADIAAAYRLKTYASIGSTNEAALDLAASGDPGNVWLVADEQTGGRGRHGRVWSSLAGNLHATLLLIDPAPIARCAELGFVAGAAAAQAVGTLVPRSAYAIKWPNDLVAATSFSQGEKVLPKGADERNERGNQPPIGVPSRMSSLVDRSPSSGRSAATFSLREKDGIHPGASPLPASGGRGLVAKFSGLLLEARQMSRGRNAVAVGIGINCRSHPEGLAYPTTDLSTIAGRPIEPADVFVPLSVSLAKMLAVWNRGADFARVRAIWLDFAAGLGDVVRVVTGSRSIQGVFETIDVQGRLVLRTDRGPVTVDAGDVFLGPA